MRVNLKIYNSVIGQLKGEVEYLNGEKINSK